MAPRKAEKNQRKTINATYTSLASSSETSSTRGTRSLHSLFRKCGITGDRDVVEMINGHAEET
jgi:hypothetical protein